MNEVKHGNRQQGRLRISEVPVSFRKMGDLMNLSK